MIDVSLLHQELDGLLADLSSSGGKAGFLRDDLDADVADADQAARAKYLILAGSVAAINSRADRGIELLERAADVVDSLAPDDLYAPTPKHVWRMNNSLGTCLDDAQGRLPDAVRVHERALSLANEIEDTHLRGISQCNLGWVLTRMGRFTEAIFQLEQVAGSEFENNTNYAYARDTNAMILEMHGDDQRAYIYRKIAYEATPASRPRQAMLAGSDVVRSAAIVGEHGVAQSIVESVREAHKEFPDSLECACRIQLMEMTLAYHAGDTESALAIAHELMKTHPENERVRDEEWAARLLISKMHREQGRLDEALDVLAVGPDEELGVMYTVRRLEELTATHRAKGDWETALRFHREAANVRSDQRIDVAQFLRLDIAHRDDIAERNLELSRAYDELVAMHARKRDLLDIVAHELRGPVGGLRLALELAREDERSLQRALATCQTIVNRMRLIVRTVETDRGLHEGVLSLSVRPTSLRALLDRVLAELIPRAETKQIAIAVDLENDAVVLADPLRLEQAIANLVENAIKFCDRAATIQVSSRVEGGWAQIVVEDDGPGFSESDMERVFAKRTKLSAKPTGGESTSGLGLYISRELVKRMGGSLELESQAGKGARFTCQLGVVP